MAQKSIEIRRLSRALALAAATLSASPIFLSRCSSSSEDIPRSLSSSPPSPSFSFSFFSSSKTPISSLAEDTLFIAKLRSLATSSGSAPLINSRAPYSSTLVPLIPEALAGEEAVESRDPLAFTENCFLRAFGAVVVGGVLGFGIGALFSGYGALAPYDPALRDWQLVQEHQKQLAAAKIAQTTTGTTTSTTVLSTSPTPTTSTTSTPTTSHPASMASSLQRNTIAEVLAPVHLPVLNGPGAVPMSFPEPPTMSLRQAFVTGLREMVVRGWASGKSFGIVGGIYTVVDCNLEKLRGVKDFKSAVASGFITGAVIAAPAGVSAAIIGGSGFALFSALSEVVSPILFDH
jgi:hypothetical protein